MRASKIEERTRRERQDARDAFHTAKHKIDELKDLALQKLQGGFKNREIPTGPEAGAAGHWLRSLHIRHTQVEGEHICGKSTRVVIQGDVDARLGLHLHHNLSLLREIKVDRCDGEGQCDGAFRRGPRRRRSG